MGRIYGCCDQSIESAGQTNCIPVSYTHLKNRTEIKEAYEKGQGEDTRMSNTLRKQTYYYAVRLKDGTILRMSRETQTIIKQMEDIIPIIMLMLAVVTILSMILSKMSTDRIVEPDVYKRQI